MKVNFNLMEERILKELEKEGLNYFHYFKPEVTDTKAALPEDIIAYPCYLLPGGLEGYLVCIDMLNQQGSLSHVFRGKVLTNLEVALKVQNLIVKTLIEWEKEI